MLMRRERSRDSPRRPRARAFVRKTAVPSCSPRCRPSLRSPLW